MIRQTQAVTDKDRQVVVNKDRQTQAVTGGQRQLDRCKQSQTGTDRWTRRQLQSVWRERVPEYNCCT